MNAGGRKKLGPLQQLANLGTMAISTWWEGDPFAIKTPYEHPKQDPCPQCGTEREPIVIEGIGDVMACPAPECPGKAKRR